MKAAVGYVNAASHKETRRGLRKTLKAEEWFCRVGILLSGVSVVKVVWSHGLKPYSFMGSVLGSPPSG